MDNKISPCLAVKSAEASKILKTRIAVTQISVCELLEPRIALAVNIGAGLESATTLNVVQTKELINGLEDIGSLANALEDTGVFAEQIEAVGLSFGDLFNFGTSVGLDGFMGDAFRDPLDGLFTSTLPGGPSVAQINNWLRTSPSAGTTGGYTDVTWSLIQGGEYAGANPFEWEVSIGGKLSTERDLVMGQNAVDADIAFGTAPKVAVDADVLFKFSFGLTDNNKFFATLGDLSFNFSGQQPIAGMTGDLEYTVGSDVYPFTIASGSTVALGGQFNNVAVTGAGSADGTWTRKELSDLANAFVATDFSVGSVVDDGMDAEIRFTAGGGVPVLLLLSDMAAMDAISPTIEHDVALLDYVAGGNITGIFQVVQDVAALLDNNPLRQVNLPGIGTAVDTMEGLPGFADLLTLRDSANTYMTTVAAPTFNGLATTLNTYLNGALTTAGITLDTLTLSTGFDPATSAMLLNFTVDTGDLSKTFQFDRLGAAATQAGLSFDRDQTLAISGTVRAQGDFGFGLDLTKASADAAGVFFSAGNLGATVSFDATGINLEAILGPVAASIVGGEVHGDASLLVNIAGDGRSTLTELTVSGEAMFEFAATGTFQAVLPLDIQIAGATFVDPEIRISTNDIFNKLPTVETGTASFDKIFNMGKVGPDAVLDLIIAVGDWASNFRDADIFDVNIPFLDADLGQAFDFGLLFTKNLRDKLQNDLVYVALKADFAAFTLASAAPLVIGDGDAAESILLPAGTYGTKQGLVDGFNTALGAASKFQAETHGDNGVRISAKNANEISDFAVMGATHQLKTIGLISSSTVVTSEVTLPLNAPTNGKLTGDAKFQLSIDGSTPVTVTIGSSSTSTNTSVADLAADVDAALASHGIDAVAAGGKLKLVHASGLSFMVLGISGTSFQQLGIENASAAGLTDLGSTLQSGLNYETLTDMVPFLLAELGLDDGDADPSNDLIRARYDIATETFFLHFEHAFDLPNISVPVGFNFDLDGWANIHTIDASGNPADATLTFTPSLSGSFDFGINVGNNSAFEEIAVTAPTGFAPNGYGDNSEGNPDPNNALAWNGRLSADATFAISMDDGVEHTLSVAKDATNTSVNDLLVDVQAAISANPNLNGKIDARVISKTGGTSDRIEFFTLEQTSSDFQIQSLRVRATGVDKMGFPADQVNLSTATVLAVSNNAQGSLDYSPATDVSFSVSLDGADPKQITVAAADMAANTTLTDLLADVNAAIAASPLNGKLQAIRYGASASQFQIVAAEGTRQMTFVADSTAAQTTLNFGTETIVTRSRGGDFFVENAQLDGTAQITLADFDLAARLGFIGLTTTGLSGVVDLTASVQLIEGTNTRFEVGELFDRLSDGTISDIVAIDYDGTATATMTGLKVDAGMLNLGVNADVVLAASDIFAVGGPNFTVTFNGFDPTKLLNFSNASWRDIYQGIKLGVEVLSQTEQFSFLGDTKIPLINISIAEVFTYTDQLVAAVDALEQDPGGALDAVELKIEELLGIPDENFDLSLEDGSVVRIHLGISTSFSESYGLDFDFAEIAKYTNTPIPADLLTLGGFLQATAEGSLQFGAYAGLSLDLGLDFSAGANPSLIVYASSGLDLGVRVTGQNLNLSASLGPAGIEITDGEVIFDSDGIYDANGDDLQDSDFATIHFGPLADITDIQGTIDDISGGAPLSNYFGPTINGVIKATLPGAITSEIGSLDLPGPIVVDVAEVGKLFSSDPLVRKNSVVLTLPDMTELLPEIPGLIQLLRDPAILLDGVDGALGTVQKLLNGKTATNLPLIGDQLRAGAGFIQEFRSGFIADLTNKLRGAGDNLLSTMQVGMFDLFGSSADGATGLALDILKDYNSDGGITKDDIVLTFRKADGSIWVEGTDAPQDQEAVQFNLHLGQGVEFGTDLDIEWGLPGLELDINGNPQITAGWDLYFGFGVSVNDFFYLDAAPPVAFTGSGATLAEGVDAEHELSLTFEVVLTSNPATPFSATGRLFFLQLDAVDQSVDGEYSHVSGAIFVDINDPGTGSNADERVTVRELFSRGGAIQPISAGLEAEAVVNLGLTASVEGSAVIPRVLADFNLEWNFVAGQPVQTPAVGFDNVRLDLGSFVSDFLKPIVNKIDEIIKPFDPVLDALQTRIPVLSDIMGRDYTVLDLAVQFGKVDRRFVDAVLQIRELVGDIAALPDGVSIIIDLGEMMNLGSALSSPGGAKSIDTSGEGSQPVGFGGGLNSDQQQYQNTFNKSTTLSGGGFGFPILKPANAFKLLLGQEATLVTYDIPRLEVGMSMSRTFPIWGPLVGKFNGSISAYADFAVGFDTKGFNTYRTSGDVLDILDGFFVSDRANADGTGADVPEAGFKGRIGIGGAINAAIIEAGIEGFFELSADLDLKDPNDDGKIRGSEMIALLNHPNGYGPLNLGSIRLRGEVGARAYVDFWAPFDWYNAWEWEFARVTLFDKTFTAPDVTPELASSSTVNGEVTVFLNAGTTANQRDFISTSDVGEEYIISGTGKNITVSFTNTGHSQSFSNVDRVVMSGGKGNDRLILGAGVTTAATFDGGEGDDYFEGGAGNDIVIGGIGNDILIGNGGSNTLDGGAGADVITGGSGADTIIGGTGDDVLKGGGGSDIYKFANDWGNDYFDGEQTGSGAFDFTKVTKDLILNISAMGAQGSSGDNFIAFESTQPYVNLVLGGSGNDVATIAATGPGTVTINGGDGTDQYLVSFGRLDSAIEIQDTGIGANDSDTVAIRPLTSGYVLGVGDLYVTGQKTGVATQRANFTNGIENLTVDAKANGGSKIEIREAISFSGDVRLLAREATIQNTIDAGNLRLESTLGVNIAADVNAHNNGNVTVLVNGGNITITEDVMSSSGPSGFTGDGAGLVHLFTAGGAILTGQGNGGPGRILAGEGSLLLRGTNGNIGTLNTPIYSTVEMLAASTSGSGLINLQESDGVIVTTIGSIEGIKTTGGVLNLFNNDNELLVLSPITLGGGNGTLMSDEIQINANVTSAGGNLFLRPEGDQTLMAVGDNVTGVFDLDQSEINHLVNGFSSIQIGLPLGRNLINLGDASFTDVTLLQNPVLGGHVDQSGEVNVTDGASFTIFGSGHTTQLGNQTVAGDIDIIDSAVVNEGATVTLTSSGGSININFDLDGTAGGADEKLILNAAGDVVIKGAIGSVAQLGTLQITGATNIRFEGSVNVKHLILDDGATFTVDGTFTGEDVALNGVTTATFHSGLLLSSGISTTGSALNSVIFEGQVVAPSVTLTASQLIDFYQLVDVSTALNVRTTSATGDIIFRQQVDSNTGDITVQSGDDITFIGPVAGDDLTVTSADALAFQANVELTGSLIQTAGSSVTRFQQFSAENANITSAGLILGGITTFSAAGGLVVNLGAGAFDAEGSVSAPAGPLTINAGTITFESTVSAASAALTALNSITVANSSNFTLTGGLTASTSSAAVGEIKFTGPVNIGAAATLTTPRSLTFQGALDVATNLTVTSASSAQYQGAVAVGGVFTQQAGVNGASSFSSTLQAGSLSLQADSFSFSGDVTSNGAASITAKVGAVNAVANLSAAGALTVGAATNIVLSGATTAHSVGLTAVGTINIGAGGISTAASPTAGNITLTTTGAVAGNSLTLNGAIDAKGVLGITAARGVLASNTLSGASLTASGTALTINSLVTTSGAASFTASAALNLAAGINAGGAFTVTGASSVTLGDAATSASASITATNTINISVGGLSSSSGDITLTTTAAGAGNAISALGLIDAAGSLNISTPRNASINLVEAGNLNIAATSISLPSAVEVTGATSLTAAASGNITSGSTITTGGALTIDRAKAVIFSGLVSAGSVGIGQGGSDAIESVTVGVGGMATTGDLRIRTTVAGSGNGITTQGALSTGTAATISLSSARGVDANGSIESGDLIVNAAGITLRSGVETSDDITFTSTGSISTLADLVATGDLVVTEATALSFAARLEADNLTISNTASATFSGTVLIGNDATIALSGDLNTGAAMTVGDVLAITSVRDASFSGLVSAATINIGSNSARVVTVGASGMTAAGNLTIETDVAGSGNGIISSGTLTAGNSATLSLSSVRGVDVVALATGDLSVTGASITVRGITSTADDITLSSAGIVSVNADVTADDVAVLQAGVLNFGSKLTANDLSVSNTGNATFTGQAQLSGTATFALSGNLTTADFLVAGDLSVTQGAALNFGGRLEAENLTINNTSSAALAGTVAVDQDVTISLSGDLTTGSTFSVGDALSIPAVRDVSFGGLVTAASVNIGSSSARTVSVNASGMNTTGNLTLRSTALAGSLALTGPLLSNDGAISLSAAGVVNSSSAISGDTIAVSSPTISLSGALSADGAAGTGTVSLNATSAGVGTITVGGAITATGSLLTGNLVAPQSTALNGVLTVGNDLIMLAGETLNTAVQVNVARDVSLTTLSSTAGEVRLVGVLGVGRDLTLNTSRDGTFLSPVTVGRNATVSNAAALQFDGALIVGGNLTQTLGTVSSRFASISAASLDINSKTVTVTNAVTATTGSANFNAASDGKVTVGGTTSVAGALTVPRADEVSFSGNVTADSVAVGSNNVRTMAFGTNLVSAGDVTLTATNGPISVTGTLTTTATLSIPDATLISLGGTVSAANASIEGDTFVAGSDLTISTGDLTFTTHGNIGVAGKTTVAGGLTILDSGDVNLAGAVRASSLSMDGSSFLAGSTFTTTAGDVLFTTDGNIRVVGAAAVAEDLTITSAVNTTFQGQLAVTGVLTQSDGTGTTRFEGVTTANALHIRTEQQVFAGSTLRATAGDLFIESDQIDFFGGTNSVQGNAQIVLRPYNANTTIDVGSPTPTGVLDLSDVDINAMQDGFTQIIVGRSEDGTGAMLIGSSSFRDNVAFHAGSIIVESNLLVGQVLTTLESIEMTARTGSIVTNDDVFATDAHFRASDNITINKQVEVADYIILTAGTDGTGSVTINGALKTNTIAGTVDLTAGANAGNLTVTGTIATFDLGLTAQSGAILQPSGNTAASEIAALSRDGITLLTTADHITARVTGTGDIHLTDTNPVAGHFLNLGSKTDVNDGLFAANGDITVIADQSVNAYRIVASGAVTLDVGGEVYLDGVTGAPVSITGTILIDEDRMTNGQEIRFDGNIRLLRDITLTSNGGDIIITGRVNSTLGEDFGLTFNAGGGDVTIGGPIGNVVPLEFFQVNEAATFTLGGGLRVEHDIEINADSVAIDAPKGSILTTGGGELRFLPNDSAASIDIGTPANGTAAFSLSDNELDALGNGFSLIELGATGSTHDIRIESARFLDDLVINGDNITLLTSSVTQSVNGLSVVNGQDDNDITINAMGSFVQGTRAGLVAGRNGNIAITADVVSLDERNRGLIRGYGELLIQPFSAGQSITLGGNGAGFDLTTNEWAALGDTFSNVTIGRSDGSHAVTISNNLTLRDDTLIRTPVSGGSVQIGSGVAAITVQTVNRADNLRIQSAGTITVDGHVKTVGSGVLELLADYDGDGDGDLLIGQNLGLTNKALTLGNEFGGMRLQGENILIGKEVPTVKDAGVVNLRALTGNIDLNTNVDGDADGGVVFRHLKSGINTAGIVNIVGNGGGIADLGSGLISGTRGVNIEDFASVMANATKIKSTGNIVLEAMNVTLKAKTALTSLAAIQLLGNQTNGVILLEKASTISAKTSVLLDAADVQRDIGAIVKAKTVTTNEIV